MAGKDVPHKKPAKTVIKTAFFFVSLKMRASGKDYSFLFNS